jgi:hypothetical protein
MIVSGRQTAPPLTEVVLVTSRAFELSLEASPYGSEKFCVAPSLPGGRLRADVYAHLATDLESAASASRNLFRPGGLA